MKLKPVGDGVETFILCRSADRKLKEQAMRQRFAARIEKGLETLAKSCRRRKQDVGVIERRVGRLLERQQRAAKFYAVQVTSTDNGAQLTWQRRDDVWQQHEQRDGCYVLRSNLTDWTAEELWTAYTQLTEAEAAFRIQKDQLKLRPVWHQKAERVTAHILVCFLAYVLRKTLEGWSKRAGLGSSLPTLLEEMRRITSADVVVPTADGREVRMQCVVRPDASQSILLTRLGLRLPQRLKLPQGVRAKDRL